MRNILTLGLLLSGTVLMAQTVLDYDKSPNAEDNNTYIEHHNKEARPIPYPHLREADVMWTRRYWRKIVAKEKMNLPLYYPIQPTRDRASLATVLFQAVVDEGTITAYSDDEFSRVLTPREVGRTLMKVDTNTFPDLDDPTIMITTIDTINVEPGQIVEFLLKEDVFFDKQRSVMEFRILGICPVIEKEIPETGEIIKEKLFWVWYPEARNVLANAEAFNRFNSGERRTFEQIFQMRMFSSYIVQEENVFDREIRDYKKFSPMEQLLEAERIENEIRYFEHDLWEY